MQTINRSDLLDILNRRLSLDELRTVVFDLGLDWENLAGETKQVRLLNLITYYERHNRVDELISAISSRRPDILGADTVYIPSPMVAVTEPRSRWRWLVFSSIIAIGLIGTVILSNRVLPPQSSFTSPPTTAAAVQPTNQPTTADTQQVTRQPASATSAALVTPMLPLVITATHLSSTPMLERTATITPSPTPSDLAKQHFSRGVSVFNMGNYDGAIEALKQAIEISPNYADAFYILGMSYYKKGSYDLSISNYNQAIKLAPDDFLYLWSRGNAYAEKKEHVKAINDFDASIILQPNVADTYFNRGNSYAAIGRFDQAIVDFGQAIVLDPNNPNYYVNRASAYNERGRSSAAIVDANKAIQLRPNDVVAYNQRARAYEAQGDKQNAINDYKKLIELVGDGDIERRQAICKVLLRLGEMCK